MSGTKNFYKISCIVAGIFFAVGAALIGIGLAIGAWGKSVELFNGKMNINLGKDEMYTQEYTLIDKFDSMDIDADFAKIEIVKGEDYAIEYKSSSQKVDYSVKNGKLIFNETGKGHHFDLNIGNHNKAGYVKIYVPGSEFGKVDINCDMGDIIWSVPGFIDEFTAVASMGNVTISEVKANRVNIACDMGDANCDADVNSYLKIVTDMGDINLNGYMACDMDLEADMGDVYLNTYYAKSCYDYNVDTDMGDDSIIDNGGEKLPNLESQYSLNAYADMGDVTVIFGKDK